MANGKKPLRDSMGRLVGRIYPPTKRVVDEKGRVSYVHAQPLKIVPGCVINQIKVLKVHREHSHYYDLDMGFNMFGDRMIRKGRFEHLVKSVPVQCECLVCGCLFATRYGSLHPNNPSVSRWSCGCEKRPKGTGRKGQKHKPTGRPMGRPHCDLTEIVFGELEPYEWVNRQGWLCRCNCGRSCLVAKSRSLLEGKVKACRVCRPQDWDRKRGRPPRGLAA